MPYYELICDDCGKTCSLKGSVRERTERTLICPVCGSSALSTVYRTVNVLRYHKKDCDVCPGFSQAGPSSGASCCGRASGCAHAH